MKLYTSLVRLKASMNGGALPPMTPLPDSALAVVDADFTIGLGALVEVDGLGLRCPVRGCGVYRDRLRPHLDRAHADVGGADHVLALLSIPQNVKLVSQREHERASEKALARPDIRTVMAKARSLQPKDHTPEGRARRAKAAASSSRRYRTMGLRNLMNRCEAQMRHALIDLQHRLGRSPSQKEARELIGLGFVTHVKTVYGSWNAAKERFGLEQYAPGMPDRRRVNRDAVLSSIQSYYDAHGCLPSYGQAMKPTRTPLFPSAPTVMKAMGTDSWPEAMRRVASLLDIHGGRYGLPEKASHESTSGAAA